MKRRKKRRKTEVTLLACNDIDPEFFSLEIEERKLLLNTFGLQISTERFISWYTFLLSIEFVHLRIIREFNENCISNECSWYSYATASLNRCLLVFYSLFVPTTHVPSADVVQATRSRFIKLN